MQWSSEKRKAQKMLVDVIEAEMVGRDISFAMSCPFHGRRNAFCNWLLRISYRIGKD